MSIYHAHHHSFRFTTTTTQKIIMHPQEEGIKGPPSTPWGKGGYSQGADVLRSACFFARPAFFNRWVAPNLLFECLGDITNENEWNLVIFFPKEVFGQISTKWAHSKALKSLKTLPSSWKFWILLLPPFFKQQNIQEILWHLLLTKSILEQILFLKFTRR